MVIRRTTANLIVDALTLAVVLGMTATGLLIRWILPPRSGGRLSVWGLGRHDWGDVHYYLFCAFGLLVVVHVALHWSWVCAAAGRLVSAGPVAAGPVAAGKRRWYGIGFLTLTAVSLALFLLIARAQVSSSSSAYRGGHALGTHNARTAPTASTETTPR